MKTQESLKEFYLESLEVAELLNKLPEHCSLFYYGGNTVRLIAGIQHNREISHYRFYENEIGIIRNFAFHEKLN